MTEVLVSRKVNAPPSAVWSKVSDFESHPEWMSDAREVRITSPGRRSLGTTMEVSTRIGPFGVVDSMEVIEWDEGRSIKVAHVGVIRGVGELSIEPQGQGCVVSWSEMLSFPWWVGGGITAFMARPVLRRVWARNLDRLAAKLDG